MLLVHLAEAASAESTLPKALSFAGGAFLIFCLVLFVVTRLNSKR